MSISARGGEEVRATLPPQTRRPTPVHIRLTRPASPLVTAPPPRLPSGDGPAFVQPTREIASVIRRPSVPGRRAAGAGALRAADDRRRSVATGRCIEDGEERPGGAGQGGGAA